MNVFERLHSGEAIDIRDEDYQREAHGEMDRCRQLCFEINSTPPKDREKIMELENELLDGQMNNGSDAEVALIQRQINEQYDNFTAQYGIISSNANKRAFQQDSSYCLLSSLEVLDEEGKLERKADIFSKRTIRRAEPVTSVDTASEALALSIGEKAGVDLPYMAQLTGKPEEEIVNELQGVIFKNPLTDRYETSDAYLSGNVREKLQLCYYASSAVVLRKGLMLVSSGISFENFEAARAEILAQLDAVKNGEISDDELLWAKRSVASDLRSTLDSQGELEGFWLGQAVDGLDSAPAELAALAEEVTKEDVTAIARSGELDLVYFLCGEDAEDEEDDDDDHEA